MSRRAARRKRGRHGPLDWVTGRSALQNRMGTDNICRKAESYGGKFYSYGGELVAVPVSQIRTVQSSPPEMIRLPSAVTATANTGLVWSLSVASSSPLFGPQIRTVRS